LSPAARLPRPSWMSTNVFCSCSPRKPTSAGLHMEMARPAAAATPSLTGGWNKTTVVEDWDVQVQIEKRVCPYVLPRSACRN
jgi:hypothetical protein